MNANLKDVIGYITKDIYDEHSNLLLQKGTPVTALICEKLQQRHVSYEVSVKKVIGFWDYDFKKIEKDNYKTLQQYLGDKFRYLEDTVVDYSTTVLLGIFKKIKKNTFLSDNLAIFSMSHSCTYTHAINVALLSIAMAKNLLLSDEDLENLVVGALFHDVGKLLIPRKYLIPSNLTMEEQKCFYQQHPLLGYELLMSNGIPAPICAIVKQHHEQYNGKGYPDGLMGNEIDFSAGVVSVADTFDCITTAVYSSMYDIELFSPEQALAEIKKKEKINYYSAAVESLACVFRKM